MHLRTWRRVPKRTRTQLAVEEHTRAIVKDIARVRVFREALLLIFGDHVQFRTATSKIEAREVVCSDTC